jgi:putative ABC transport system permease protein
LRIDGIPIEERGDRNGRFQRPRSVTWEPELRDGIRVTDGEWWNRETTEPVLSLDEGVANWLDAHVGSVLEFDISNQTVTARVVATHVTETMRFTPDADFVFNPPALEGLPVVFYGGVRMEPASVGAVQRALYRAFPTVTVVNIADALAIAQEVIDQIALVIRFLSAFAILAGAIILAASVAGTRFRRVREVVILKTLGATKRHVGRIFSVEFLTLGAVAGLLGALLAGGFSNMVLTQLLDTEAHIDWTASAVCVVLTALMANIAGWMASFRILRQKPLEVLREE